MRKLVCALGTGMLISFLLVKKKKPCCSTITSSSSETTSSGGLDYFSKISDGLDFIENKIDEIDLESVKQKTKSQIQSIKEKITELRSS